MRKTHGEIQAVFRVLTIGLQFVAIMQHPLDGANGSGDSESSSQKSCMTRAEDFPRA
jgi:hypothetical protein